MSAAFPISKPAASPTMPEPPLSALSHIPGTDGWPVVGVTLQMLADPKGVTERFARTYGPVFRTHSFGGRVVVMLGPEANEFVLLDQARLFSSQHGWERIFGRLFPGGLMMMDFDEHRLHRKALSVAFKAGPLKSYLENLNRGIAAGVSGWLDHKAFSRDRLNAENVIDSENLERASCEKPAYTFSPQAPGDSPELLFYPAVKRLTLDLAAASFLGEEMGADLERVKGAFIDMIAATVAVVRSPLPGTQMRRGVEARQFMIDYFGRQIDARRESGSQDLFTQLCKTTTDDGRLLTALEISDHMNFLMMAAHDTLASSLSSFVYFLAFNPPWQERLREEIKALGLPPGEPLPYDRLDDLRLTEMAFNESMRLIPPVTAIRRCAVRDTEFAGFRIPRGTRVAVNPLYTHRMPEFWPEPDEFDPLRFSDEAIRARHKYAFVPFGGGAHMCLGQRFAYIQAKCFAYHFLSMADVSVRPNYRPAWSFWPIPRPRDGLQVTLTPRQ